jgi:integrase
VSESVRSFGLLKPKMATKKSTQIDYPYTLRTKFGKVKIYRGGSDDKVSYVVSWISEEGRQRKTFVDEYQAHQRAEEIADDLKKGMLLRQGISSEKAALISEYEKLLAEHGATLGEAVRAFLSSRATKAAKQIDALEAVKEYLKKFSDTKSRHYRTAKSILFKFGRSFNKPLDKIVVTELDQYFKDVSKEGKTRNNHLGYVRTFFTWAQEWGEYLPEGKLEIDKIKEPYPEKKKKPNLYTPEEMERLLVNADEKFIPYLAIGAFAGVRSSETCRLTWEDIHFDQKAIRLGPEITKTASGRLALMPDNLIAWLQRHRGEKKGRVVPYPEDQIHKYTPDIARAAGVAWKKNGLRKGYISCRMAEADADADSVAKQCGNSRSMVETVYKLLMLPEDAKRWFNILPKALPENN